jgi:hypothetical protein
VFWNDVAMLVSNRPQTIATLQSLLDELCSPDLTLGRAQALRHSVFEAVEAIHSQDSKGIAEEAGRAEIEAGRGSEEVPSAVRSGFHPEFTRFPSILPKPSIG